MMNKLQDIDFYFITDGNISKKGNKSDVSKAVGAGCRIVQYRVNNKSDQDMLKEGEELKNICKNKAFFLVNNRADIAFAIDSDGVHLGQNDLPIDIARRIVGENKIIGKTVHNTKEAVIAEKRGADYVGLAPIFYTDTKKDTVEPIGLDIIKDVRKTIDIPIVAIGGINRENVKSVILKGADAAVSVSAVISSDDVFKEVRDFIGLIREAKI